MRSRNGFTVIELLVLLIMFLVIVFILIGSVRNCSDAEKNLEEEEMGAESPIELTST